jgi:hypothetical protein
MEGLTPDVSFGDVMEHYGVKGMHWGVRRKRTDSGPTSSDAAAARVHQSTVKKSGTKALSNKELQELVTRMNLEQQYSSLHQKSKKENPAAKFAKELLIQVGKEQAGKLAREQLAKQIGKGIAAARA